MLLHFFELLLDTLVDAKSPKARRRVHASLLLFILANGAFFAAIAAAARQHWGWLAVGTLAMVVLVLASAIALITAFLAEGDARQPAGEPPAAGIPRKAFWLLAPAVLLIPPPLLLVIGGVIWLLHRWRQRKST